MLHSSRSSSPHIIPPWNVGLLVRCGALKCFSHPICPIAFPALTQRPWGHLILHSEDLSPSMYSHLCWEPASGSSSSCGQWHKKSPLIFLKGCAGMSTDAAWKTVFYWLSQLPSALPCWQGLYPDTCKYRCLFWRCTNRSICDQTARSIGTVTQDTKDEE